MPLKDVIPTSHSSPKGCMLKENITIESIDGLTRDKALLTETSVITRNNMPADDAVFNDEEQANSITLSVAINVKHKRV